jgi:hypothetical protein
MIFAFRNQDGSFSIINGAAQFFAHLNTYGRAEVVDAATNAKMYVHDLNGRLVAVSEKDQASIDLVTSSAINRARGLSPS